MSISFPEQEAALSSLQMHLWRLINNFCILYHKNGKKAAPSQSWLAKQVGVTRKHVNRTLALFKKWRWLRLKFDGFKRPKILVVIANFKEYLQVTLNPSKRGEPTAVLKEEKKLSHQCLPISRTPSSFHLEIPSCLDNLPFTLEEKLKLSLLHPHIYREANRIIQQKIDKGHKIRNREQYFIGTCFQLTKRQGLYINWKLFYKEKKRLGI